MSIVFVIPMKKKIVLTCDSLNTAKTNMFIVFSHCGSRVHQCESVTQFSARSGSVIVASVYSLFCHFTAFYL